MGLWSKIHFKCDSARLLLFEWDKLEKQLQLRSIPEALQMHFFFGGGHTSIYNYIFYNLDLPKWLRKDLFSGDFWAYFDQDLFTNWKVIPRKALGDCPNVVSQLVQPFIIFFV